MGLYSRRKGMRVEYEVRDYFRSIGYKADRVPSSGAAQGFKGDVRVVSPTNEVFLVEVKARATGFKLVYDAFEGAVNGIYIIADPNELISISRNFLHLIESHKTYTQYTDPEFTKAARKLVSFKKWLGEAQILVIKEDRKPLLFIKYEN